MKQTILTGITPTGMPHLGNYIGAFKPALDFQDKPEIDALYFIADGHSAVKLWDAKLRAQHVLEVAATWLALGLDPDKVTFYRQTDIRATFELYWFLTSITAKGLMNRAHAYKDQVNKNQNEGINDEDHGINMGLYCYPILMAADILLFNADKVPVGRDQLQHIEMARDIAARFNHVYGNTFVLPDAMVSETAILLPGLDGRKMSKSYHNTIPLFIDSKLLRKLIMKIKTNSLLPGEPKDPDTCTLFAIYSAFATSAQIQTFRAEYQQGMAWGEIKQFLFEFLDAYLQGTREKFQYYCEHQNEVQNILMLGAQKAEHRANLLLTRIKTQMGFI